MRKNGKTNAVGRGGALLRPAGYTELSKIFGESVCTYPLGRRGRCRSQPFATKERYGCGSAACRYTSARWEVTNSPQISIKTAQSAGPMRHPQASFEAQPRIARLLAPKIGIDPYTETGSAYVCAAAFCKNQLHSAGRTESSAPTKQSDIDHDRTFLTR